MGRRVGEMGEGWERRRWREGREKRQERRREDRMGRKDPDPEEGAFLRLQTKGSGAALYSPGPPCMLQ